MARMIEYLNPKPHAIQIASPDKKIIKVRANEKIVLSDWYMTYCPRYLRVVRVLEDKQVVSPKKINASEYRPDRLKSSEVEKPNKPKQHPKIGSAASRRQQAQEQREKRRREKSPRSQVPARIAESQNKRQLRERKKVVGRRTREAGSLLYKTACQNNKYIVSSNIGIGILSYNRLGSLQRLINSIRKNTNLKRVTVFVSDESTNAKVSAWLSKQTDIVVLTKQKRLGVAGNTNRLMKCLSRFRYAILLNDDVEILQEGWENFYVRAHLKTKIHHFCYHQVGVYGAKRNGRISKPSPGWQIETINEKPHGGVLFYTNKMFKTIGYFDESFGSYGMEHVDWSERAGKSGLQPSGFHDVMGSERFFKIHNEKSSAPDRGREFGNAKKVYLAVKDQPGRLKISANPQVPSVSVVIPVRNIGRQAAIETVVNSIRGQLFPNIEIILSEQDIKQNVNTDEMQPINYMLAKNKHAKQPFTKALAFNLGVARAEHDKIILQDADIIVPSHYAQKISKLLDLYEGVHIGSRVLYMSKSSSKDINKTGLVKKEQNCERAVEYFEGGSLACTKKAYFKVGGFNEIFEGYGVEDCDFFWRLKDFSKFFNSRSEDFVHLWHGRTEGWEIHHRKNKRLGQQITRRYKPANYVASLVAKLKRQYPALFRELSL